MNLTFAANLTKMIDAGLGREAAPPETFVAVGRTTEYTDLGPVPIASFETNVEAPLRALSVAMEPIQAGTGDPSPENVRPISGRSSVSVWRTGKNLFDYRDSANWRVATSATARRLPVEGEFTLDGDTLTYTRRTSLDGAVFILGYLYGGVSYTFNYPTKSQLYYAKIDGAVSDSYRATRFDQNRNTFTPPEDGFYEVLFYASSFATYTFTDIQLEEGSTATAYEAPSIASVTIQLGQTVFGGSLDVVSGVLTVDRAMVDLGTLTWLYQENYRGYPVFYSIDLRSTIVRPTWTQNSPCICSNYKSVTTEYGQNNNGTFVFINTGGEVDIRDSSYTDAATFKAAMSGVQLVYKLATPRTIQLTPEQITTLIGQNNVWSDGGDVSLTYGTVKYTEGY